MYITAINPTINNVNLINTKSNLLYKRKTTQSGYDTVSFSGIKPKLKELSCIPQNVEKMLQTRDIPDIYSDSLLLNPKILKNFDKQKTYRKSSKEIIHDFEPYEKYLQPVEKEIFKRLSKMIESPGMAKEDFRFLIRQMRPKAETELFKKENRIFNDIVYLSKGLKEKYAVMVNDFIEKQRKIVFEPQENVTFKRKRFLNELEQLLLKVRDKKTVRAIMSAASKLPTSGDDPNAFIVKYSERPAAAIAQRLITPSAASIEHIHPRSLGGENDWSNYALACVKYNSDRGNCALSEMIQKNPKIPKYIQRQADAFIELANEGIITDKNYILCYRNAFLKESEGAIDIDISALDGLKIDSKGNYYVENRFPEKKYYIMSLEKEERDIEIKKIIQEKLEAEKAASQREKSKNFTSPKFESPAEIMQRKELERKNNDFFNMGFSQILHANRLTVKDNHYNHPFKKKK